VIDPAEKAAADYLLSLPKEDRTAAEQRINQMLKAAMPPDEAAPTIPVRTLEDFLKVPIEMPPFFVSNGVVIEKELTVTIARGGKGKTTLAMNRMVRWAAGLPLFDTLPDYLAPEEDFKEKGLRILMIENEGVAYFQQKNFGTLLQHALETPEQRALAMDNILIWGDAGYSGLKIDVDADLELIDRAVAKHEPHIVIMEPFRGLWGGEENDATEMEKVLDRMVQLATANSCAVMLSHHSNKSEAGETGEWMNASRGSGVMEGKAAVMEVVRSVRGGKQTEISWPKTRYSTAHDPVRVKFEEETWMLHHIDEEIAGAEVMSVMGDLPQEWCSIDELVEETGDTKAKISDTLKQLTKEDRIIRGKADAEHKGGKFRLAVKTDTEKKGRLSI
jgi:hypothetical protein